MVRFLDFCSGIGGGRLGLEKNDFKCVGFSEILQSSIDTYKNFFDTENEKELGDLTKLSNSDIPDCELLICGFPCQTFSIQGLRQGFEDNRGQIIFYLQKILEGKKIRYFLFENVKGLVNHDNGKTLRTIISGLEESGYKVYYKVLKSNDFGLPQKRERIYFVGIRNDLQCTEYDFPSFHNSVPQLKDFLVEDNPKYIFSNYEWFNKYLNNKYNKGKYDLKELLSQDYIILDTRQSDLRIYKEYAPTLRTGRSGILYVKNKQLRHLSGREALLLQGFSDEMYEKSKELKNSLLLQQTGNSMSVNVIEALGKELKKIMKLNGDL